MSCGCRRDALGLFFRFAAKMSKREIAAAAAKKYILSTTNTTASAPPDRYHSVMTLVTLGKAEEAENINREKFLQAVTKGLPVCVTGARGSPRLSRVDGELIAISYLTKMACQPHLRSAFPHAYQGYACVSCVPGSPRYPHPLTRLCVWRLPPARLLVDPGVPGSTFHTPPRAGCSR